MHMDILEEIAVGTALSTAALAYMPPPAAPARRDFQDVSSLHATIAHLRATIQAQQDEIACLKAMGAMDRSTIDSLREENSVKDEFIAYALGQAQQLVDAEQSAGDKANQAAN